MRNLLLSIFVLLFILTTEGCLLSRSSDSGSSSDDGGGSSGGGTTATTVAYARGRLPNVLTTSSSAPASYAISNTADWTVKATTLSRTATPSADGTFSIPVYSTDSLSVGTAITIQVLYKDAVVSGHTSLESATLYATTDSSELSLPDIQVGIMSTGKYILVSTSADSANSFYGWDYYSSAKYTEAVSKFDEVIASATATSADKANAYAGKGWCRIRTNGLSDSNVDTYFASGSDDSLGKIGRACVYVSKGDNISGAVTLLEGIGLSAASYEYTSGEIVGISSDAAHALLAMCYAYTGRNDLAEIQTSGRSGNAGSVENQVALLLQSFGAY